MASKELAPISWTRWRMKFFDWRLLGTTSNILLWCGTTPILGICELITICQRWSMSCPLLVKSWYSYALRFNSSQWGQFVTICPKEQNLKCMIRHELSLTWMEQMMECGWHISLVIDMDHTSTVYFKVQENCLKDLRITKIWWIKRFILSN